MSKPDFDPLVDLVPSRYVVGIDLGTTNSAVTWIDTEDPDGQIEVLAIRQVVAPGETESLDTLPSFHFQPVLTAGNVEAAGMRLPWDPQSLPYCVGTFARNETARTSGRGIASAKSWLCHAAVDRTSDLLPWQGAEDVQRLSPVEVSGRYLRHIRKAWDALHPQHPLAEQDIVLTLPASFDEVARELTIQAAASAGLKRVVLIEEPQAAFYAWVNRHADNWDQQVSVGQKILVCDIGGGTTDFTLIRVRNSDAGNAEGPRIQFHRVAVGQHLILGGDNLDLAIARYLEQKLSPGKPLPPYQWDVLVGSSRQAKEQLLGDGPERSVNVTLPQRGAKLLGGVLSTEVSSSEIQKLILDGFLPEVSIDARPIQATSGFQEFGLPYASDPAITRYLADFLVTHATAGAESNADLGPEDFNRPSLDAIRPDVVLFNGGFFASPILRSAVLDQLRVWFRTDDQPTWEPDLLDNDRLDLAVARGATYYGLVRRNRGVRITASLARSYYIAIGGNPAKAICLIPGSAEAGQFFELDHVFQLTLSQPVEFSILVSSTRLADTVGQIVDLDPDQMKSLPPIRTAIKARSRNEQCEVPVRLQTHLTELGTIELACLEIGAQRNWKLQFDIRSATQTDQSGHLGVGETEGILDETTWESCRDAIASVFAPDGDLPPKQLVPLLDERIGAPRSEWPMPLMRRIWEALLDLEPGRRKSTLHESRWLNLLGYSLRPGYGVAIDDWRVTETWRKVNGKLVHASPAVRNESLILWRRLAGGLSRGQQSAIAEPFLASIRTLARKLDGKQVKNASSLMRPEESVEVWRLLGSLEWLAPSLKQEMGDLIVRLLTKTKLASAHDAMRWTLGRLGQRRPVYGPMNCVVDPTIAEHWIEALLAMSDCPATSQLAMVQMARRTNDRYRDIQETVREKVIKALHRHQADSHWIKLVQEGGQLDREVQGRVLGESLPAGLRLE